MKNLKLCSLFQAILLVSLSSVVGACGSEDSSPASKAMPVVIQERDATLIESLAPQLPGTYELPENRGTRMLIDGNLLVSTNLSIPSPIDQDTRLTPRFPQALQPLANGVFRSVGTYNDGTGVFKNIELRVRLYNENRFLDVTLTTPPTPEACLQPALKAGSEEGGDFLTRSRHPGQNPGGKPGEGGHDSCCCLPKDQLIYPYRFERVSQESPEGLVSALDH